MKADKHTRRRARKAKRLVKSVHLLAYRDMWRQGAGTYNPEALYPEDEILRLSSLLSVLNMHPRNRPRRIKAMIDQAETGAA